MNTQKSATSSTGLLLNFSPVQAEKIVTPEDSAKNGVVTNRHRIQLRQEVSTTYPAARDNELYLGSEIDARSGQAFVEKRVAWLNVPPTATVADIQARLNQMDSPKLVRILDLKPILSADQQRTIDNGRNPKSLEDYENDCVLDGEGKPVLYRGLKQYRKIVFSKLFSEDEDNRATTYEAMVKAQGGVQIASPATADNKVAAKI